MDTYGCTCHYDMHEMLLYAPLEEVRVYCFAHVCCLVLFTPCVDDNQTGLTFQIWYRHSPWNLNDPY